MTATTDVLFLCTGNSCRSQMAEALCRAIASDRFRAFSAGAVAKGMNPRMIQVMREVGIDPTIQQSSKTLDCLVLAGQKFDVVVTVCGHAHELCLHSSHTLGTIVHQPFDDPPALEAAAPHPAAALDIYRRVRDEIRRFILSDRFLQMGAHRSQATTSRGAPR